MRLFFHASKQSHEVGLKYIGLYLSGTREKELIMTPDKTNLKLHLFADVDFAGLLCSED